MPDIFKKLRRSPYPQHLVGLEECLPRFYSASIALYSGKKRRGSTKRSKRKHRKPQKRLTYIL